MTQAIDMDTLLASLLQQLEERKTQSKHQSMEKANYRAWLEREWATLLNSDSQNDESVFQHFIEQHTL